MKKALGVGAVLLCEGRVGGRRWGFCPFFRSDMAGFVVLDIVIGCIDLQAGRQGVEAGA